MIAISLLISAILLSGICVDASPLRILRQSNSTTLVNVAGPSIDVNQRSIWDVIWSCSATIVACSWVSAHPNIPPPDADRLSVALRRLELMFWSIICPEIIIFWAMRQWIGARNLMKINQENSLRFGNGWTKAHGYFLQMGGFILCDGNKAMGVLNPNAFGWGMYDGKIVMPSITEKEITDRSKADGLSKGIIIMQTTWFVIQCVARKTEGLPITQLELVTLALSLLNGFMYFLWWDKPLDVQSTVKVYLMPVTQLDPSTSASATPTIAAREAGDATRRSSPDEPRQPHHATVSVNDIRNHVTTAQPRLHFAAPSINLTPRWSTAMAPQMTFLTRSSVFTRSTIYLCSSLRAMVSIAVHIAVSIAYRMREVTSVWQVPNPADLSVHPFFAHDFTKAEDYTYFHFSYIPFIGAVFGAIHCTGWNFFFPSSFEAVIWRTGSIIVTGLPTAVLILVIWATFPGRHRFRTLELKEFHFEALHPLLSGSTVCLLLLYIIARLALLIGALSALRDLPPGVYATVKWTSIFPHI